MLPGCWAAPQPSQASAPTAAESVLHISLSLTHTPTSRGFLWRTLADILIPCQGLSLGPVPLALCLPGAGPSTQTGMANSSSVCGSCDLQAHVASAGPLGGRRPGALAKTTWPG